MATAAFPGDGDYLGEVGEWFRVCAPCNSGNWEANSRLIIMLSRSSSWKKVAACFPGRASFTRGKYLERNWIAFSSSSSQRRMKISASSLDIERQFCTMHESW
jgi:hypothetical protein